MPNKNIHLFFDKHILHVLNDTSKEVHEWIDEPVKRLGMAHRAERHDTAAIIYCGKHWGITGLNVAALHMIVDGDLNCDLGIRYFDREVEKIKIDEPIRYICNHYAENLYDYYSGNLKSYRAKAIYSQNVAKAKALIPKGILLNIKKLVASGKKFVFFSDEYNTDILSAAVLNHNKKLISNIETNSMSLELNNLLWDYRRTLDSISYSLQAILPLYNCESYEEIKKTRIELSSVISLTVEGKFAAAHSISSFPKEHKCNNIHGHEWRYKCNFVFQKSEVTKISEDFGKVKEVLRRRIESRLDHSNLNNMFGVSSAEEISKWIFEQVSEEYEELMYVTVKETETSWVTYNQECKTIKYEEFFDTMKNLNKKIGQLNINDFNKGI